MHLESEGIRVLRFSNIEVMEEFEGVCQKIGGALKPKP
jgi:very-short-patch-repair endonuclease